MSNLDLQAVKSYMVLRLRFSETDEQKSFAPVQSTLFEVSALTDRGIEVANSTEVQVKRLITAANAVDRTSEVSQLLGHFTSDVTDHLLVTEFTLYYLLMLDDNDWKTIIKPAVAVKTPRQFIRACLTAIPENPINPSAFRFIRWTQLIPRYAESDAAKTGMVVSSLLSQYMAEGACTDAAAIVDASIVEAAVASQVVEATIPPVKKHQKDNTAKPVDAPKAKAKPTKPVKQPILPAKKKKRRRSV